ncbi:PrgI family mobile element protein [Clostridium sp.]|uniref:PrgI family mobile element protein n=1 Tax=Clostridium sp. TaxID=1506 RepID=UPI001B6ADA2B|nr:PrgI family protein [Clostridium sp.]MBP3915709.1 PrgI family protein [Clostridium sp.]
MKYKIPIDSREEEKAIGGIITFKQFGWLAGGFSGSLAVFGIFYGLTRSVILTLVVAIIPFICSLPFAFLKLHDMSLWKYINAKKVFKSKTPTLFNKKEGV